MPLPDHYRQVVERRDVPPSVLIALLHEDAEMPTSSGIPEHLERAGFEVLAESDSLDPLHEAAYWEIGLRVQEADRELVFRIWAEAAESLSEFHLDDMHLSDVEREAMGRSRWAIGVACQFGDRPLADFHNQLRATLALAPDSPVVVDVAAGQSLSGEWVRETAGSPVPPAPRHMFRIHGVHDRGRAWLHTHGLLRCGTLELEMLDVPEEHMRELGELINTIAPFFIEEGPPEPGLPFTIGDRLQLAWLPWEEAIERVPGGILGTGQDRDVNHAFPSAVLFVPTRRLFRRRLVSPEKIVKKLERNPVFWISVMETERMALLARHRLDRFEALMERFARDEQWAFLIKLGYPIQDTAEENAREHLWFRVHRFEVDGVDATLLNEPYNVAGLHEGDRAMHELRLLTDWQIIGPHGAFGPDTVMHLERELSE